MGDDERQRQGRRIRDEREARGLTQAELAAAAGMGTRTLSDVENGKRITEDKLFRLRRALELEPEPDDTRALWPKDVQTFLDPVGAWLSSLPENIRHQHMRSITRLIHSGASPNP